VHGHTPDISSLSEYDFYEPVYYYDPGDFPSPKLHIGRWLGEAVNIGQAMTYYILPPSGIPIVRSTVQPIPKEEKARDEVREELRRLDTAIQDKLGDTDMSTHSSLPEGDYFHLYDAEDNSHVDIQTPAFDPMEDGNVPEAEDYDPEELDQFLSVQVCLPHDNQYVLGTVLSRKRDLDGNPIGKAHDNPLFDTRIYMVGFPDGHVEEFSTNVIAECLYSQIDQEGNQYLLIDEIIDHNQTLSDQTSVDPVSPMDEQHLQRVGTFVCYGKMVVQVGNHSRI
jgi:hypothetical protein